jgi:methylenetetrahydrofolate--tRNA-(uracil-5-)-methyltransferase
MRPRCWTPAHRSAMLAELVCSNSLGSSVLPTASAALMNEMVTLGSLLVPIAMRCRIPAGKALAVDRTRFSAAVTKMLAGCGRVRILRREARRLPDDGVVVVATGPLTSGEFSDALAAFAGREHLHFYDALSPIVSAESLGMGSFYRASRYDAGDGFYHRFVDELRGARVAEPRRFEQQELFRACQPVEELARAGVETLAHGPLRPMGLRDPRNGSLPHAVVQLRPENLEETCYGLVGFQTRLTRSEQRRVFRLIPGLERAEFLRYGAVHRNSFLDAPKLLSKGLVAGERILVAGQLTGAEGYLEAAATGLLAGENAVRVLRGDEPVEPPPCTVLGSLIQYLRTGPRTGGFQPMNVHFGLLPPLEQTPASKYERRQALCRRAFSKMKAWSDETLG